MKKKIKYSAGPVRKLRLVKDFLPSPAVLKRAKINVKVTLDISLSTHKYFRNLSEKTGISYQKIIRDFLIRHVSQAA